MDATAWLAIGSGITILIASEEGFRSLQREMRLFREDIKQTVTAIRDHGRPRSEARPLATALRIASRSTVRRLVGSCAAR